MEKKKSEKMMCSVSVVVAGVTHSLGDFPMLPSDGGAYFDYYALAEDLVNMNFMDDEDEATAICEHIERVYNEDGKTEGTYVSADGIVTVAFTIKAAD